MKRPGLVSECVGLAAAAALGVAGSAMGQLRPPAAAASADAGQTATATPQPPDTTPVMGMFRGTVAAVDRAAGTIDVSVGAFGDARKTLTVTDETKVRMNGRPATPADLTSGTAVTAFYETHGGQTVATDIEIVSAAGSERRDGRRSLTGLG
jgi:hypothetical protein